MFQFDQVPTVSGHVFRREGKRGAVRYAKYRLPDGRQVQKRIGPAWSGSGRPADGHFTKRSAQAWLRAVLREAEAGTLPGAVRTGATFADAAAEWLRYVAEDRACKPTTLRDYRISVRSQFLPAFGDRRLEDITTRDIERWRAGLTSSARTKNKLLTQLNGIFKRARKVYGLPRNPAADVEKLREPRCTDLEVFSPEEVHALVRAAASEQDAAIFLTAAFTGLRMGTARAALARHRFRRPGRARARELQRRPPDDPEERQRPLRTARRRRRGHAGAAGVGVALDGPRRPRLRRRARRLPRRLRAAPPLQGGTRPRRPAPTGLPRPAPHVRHAHDRPRRHPEGQGVDGHANVQTTMRYLHFVPRADAARLVDEAFALEPPALPTPTEPLALVA